MHNQRSSSLSYPQRQPSTSAAVELCYVQGRAPFTISRAPFTAALAVYIAALAAVSAPTSGQTVIGGSTFVNRGITREINLGVVRGSLGVIDYDGDGWYDLFIPDYPTRPNRLFRNVPSATTPGGRNFVDVSQQAGLWDADSTAQGFGSVVIFDFNNDGAPDIFTAGNATSSGVLYRNNGNGTFTNVSIWAHVRQSNYFIDSASAIDFDHDGFTDLMLCPIVRSGQAIQLLRNNGDGTFTARPDLLPTVFSTGHIYAHVWSDYDHDGWTDVIICLNAFRPLVFKNVEAPDGGRQLIDATTASGFTSIGPAPMGIAPGDFDGDGDIDFAITDASTGTYYENRNGTLVRIRPFNTFFGWGTTWIDAENDGDLDNYQAGSYAAVNYDFLHLNEGPAGGPGTGPIIWTDAREALNTEYLASQQSARIDFDNDGRQDIVTIQPDESISVYHNQSPSGNNWFAVRLRGRGGLNPVNSDAVGAIVTIDAGGRTQVREHAIGTSFGSSEDPRAHFGIAAATTVDRIEVVWPRAGTRAERTQIFVGPFAAGQVVTLEPDAPCAADFNQDGGVDGADVGAFFAAWSQARVSADVNIDGGIDGADVESFFGVWSSGGC